MPWLLFPPHLSHSRLVLLHQLVHVLLVLLQPTLHLVLLPLQPAQLLLQLGGAACISHCTPRAGHPPQSHPNGVGSP